jgi:hypothetical protein
MHRGAVLLLLLAHFPAQEPKKPEPKKSDPRTAEADEIPGFPDGEAPKLPARVSWALNERTLLQKTRLRQRYNLGGLWRFAPVAAPDMPVERPRMGWIELPALWNHPNTRVFDANFRASDGLWNNRQLGEFPIAWVEREIPTPTEWLARRVFLQLRGPWAAADVYVNAELLKGEPWPGGRRIEITSALIYPGDSLLDMRLSLAAPAAASSGNQPAPAPKPATPATRALPDAPPAIELELTPTGPRMEAVRLRRDSSRGEIEATFDLMRPEGFPLVAGPRISTLSFAIEYQMRDPAGQKTLVSGREEVGQLEQLTRTVTLRIPTSQKGQPALNRGVLQFQLAYAKGSICDEPFPIECDLTALSPVE